MKKCLWLGLVALLAVGITAVYAGEEPKKQEASKTGIVKKVDVEGKTVTVTVKRELTFTVTDDTKIVAGDAKKTLADIKEGAKVTVSYLRDGDKRVATKIAIEAAEKEK